MKKLLATLLMGAALSGTTAVNAASPTRTPEAPTTSVKAESNDTIWIAGPFATYFAAANYADYLEYEYGYITEVVFDSGLYFVLYV
jgi:hypothetical protein